MAGVREPITRIPIPGGEARCVLDTATSWVLEVQLGDRALRETWDPRDTDVIHFAGVTTWAVPSGVALTCEEREAVLDGLWTLAPRTGLRAILTRDAAGACHVARRWDRGDDGQLVDVHDTYVDVLELGRTARVPATPIVGSPAEAMARIAEARWAYPAGAVMIDADRARLAAKLARSGDGDQRIASFTWRLRVE